MNKAAQLRAKFPQDFPGATLNTRHKHALIWDLPGGQKGAQWNVGDTPIHFGDGPYDETNEIDTAWVDTTLPSDQPWLKVVERIDGIRVRAFQGNDEFSSAQPFEFMEVASGEWVRLTMRPLRWVNDLDQEEQIAIPQNVSPTSINDNEIEYASGFGPGLGWRQRVGSRMLLGFLDVLDLASLGGAPPQFILDGGNAQLAIQFEFHKSSNITLWIDGLPWDEKANNPQDTANLIEFRRTDNQSLLFYLKLPVAHDEGNLDNLPLGGTLHFWKSGNSLFVEKRFPWAAIQNFAFPAWFDAAWSVAASADDAYESHSNANCTVTDTENRCDCGVNSGSTYTSGFNFTLTSGPDSGDPVNTCTMSGSVLTNRDDPNLTMYCYAVDGSSDGAFSCNTDSPRDRLGTVTTGTTWIATGVGPSYTSDDFSSEAQEVIDLEGWASGNDLTVIFDPLDESSNVKFRPDTQDNGSGEAALTMTWTPAGGGGDTNPGWVGGGWW